MKCPICNTKEEEMRYPKIDGVTGFCFCDGCLYAAMEKYHQAKMDRAIVDEFSTWLEIIAKTRLESIKF